MGAPEVFGVLAVLVAICWAIINFARLSHCCRSSMSDPHWSVAPSALSLFWALYPAPSVNHVRRWVVVILVCNWGARLTFNRLRGWHKLSEEDWRYQDLRKKWGAWYWPGSFVALHFVPTMIMFFATLPAAFAVVHGTAPLNLLDLAASILCLGGTIVEAVADEQMHAYQSTPAARRPPVLKTGLWSWCRHPNYAGELAFWWGLFMFSLASSPGRFAVFNVWGGLLVTVLLASISRELHERKMQKQDPVRAEAWEEYRRTVPGFPCRCGKETSKTE